MLLYLDRKESTVWTKLSVWKTKNKHNKVSGQMLFLTLMLRFLALLITLMLSFLALLLTLQLRFWAANYCQSFWSFWTKRSAVHHPPRFPSSVLELLLFSLSSAFIFTLSSFTSLPLLLMPSCFVSVLTGHLLTSTSPFHLLLLLLLLVLLFFHIWEQTHFQRS